MTTYNPLDNDDLRKIIFSYLRTPCEYKQPPHYRCMRLFCVSVFHEEIYVLNPLLSRLKYAEYVGIDDYDEIKDRLNASCCTIGECMLGSCYSDDEVEEIYGDEEEMFYNLQPYINEPIKRW